MMPLDRCPRADCGGTLLFDEYGALRCLLCNREQEGGHESPDGRIYTQSQTRFTSNYGQRHTYGPPVVNLVSESLEGLG